MKPAVMPERQIVTINDALKDFFALPRAEALGAAMALILDASDKQPALLARMLTQTVVRQQYQTVQQARVIDVLIHVAQRY